jgi:hypothetical protein
MRPAGPPRVFLLSPARCDGRRARMLLSPAAEFPLALELRRLEGAAVGDVFAFLSGLYFRGKLTYARAFASADLPVPPIRVITTNRGLVTPEYRVRPADLTDFACVDLGNAGEQFEAPLVRDANQIAAGAPSDAQVVLLGSIATNKYVGPLLRVFKERLLFPREFVGRGDMSRGGLMLRQVDAGRELEYVPVANAVRHGARPPKLSARTSSAR